MFRESNFLSSVDQDKFSASMPNPRSDFIVIDSNSVESIWASVILDLSVLRLRRQEIKFAES